MVPVLMEIQVKDFVIDQANSVILKDFNHCHHFTYYYLMVMVNHSSLMQHHSITASIFHYLNHAIMYQTSMMRLQYQSGLFMHGLVITINLFSSFMYYQQYCFNVKQNQYCYYDVLPQDAFSLVLFRNNQNLLNQRNPRVVFQQTDYQLKSKSTNYLMVPCCVKYYSLLFLQPSSKTSSYGTFV